MTDPTTKREVASLVSRMFLGWPSMRAVDPETMGLMVRAYADDLDGVPLEFVRAAIGAARQGRLAGNPEFPPSSASVASEARRLRDDARAKEAAARPKLTPPSYAEGLSPEERAEKAAKLRAMIAEATRPMAKASTSEDAA